MVGVPDFFLCVSGVSSRTFEFPCWIFLRRLISAGPSTMPRTSERMAADTIRKDGYRKTLKSDTLPESG